jgi:hypothetical protein
VRRSPRSKPASALALDDIFIAAPALKPSSGNRRRVAAAPVERAPLLDDDIFVVPFRCDYGCAGTEMSNGGTVHEWHCEYWIDNPDATPF